MPRQKVTRQRVPKDMGTHPRPPRGPRVAGAYMDRFASVCAAIGIAVLGAACSSATGPGETLTLEVAELRAACVGVMPRECLLIRTDPDAEFSLFHEEIIGFDYKPGFRYRLLVSRHERRNPPQDAASHFYRLIRVESRVASRHAVLLVRMREAEDVWQRTRVLPYQMVKERICFCAPTGPVRIEVVGEPAGAGMPDREIVVARQFVLDGRDVPAASAAAFLSVQDLFVFIRNAALDDAHRIEAEFDVLNGYPLRVYVDPEQQIADDEVEYRVLSLNPA
jgi:hypothetical protein